MIILLPYRYYSSTDVSSIIAVSVEAVDVYDAELVTEVDNEPGIGVVEEVVNGAVIGAISSLDDDNAADACTDKSLDCNSELKECSL